jgi:hypothetical protein
LKLSAGAINLAAIIHASRERERERERVTPHVGRGVSPEGAREEVVKVQGGRFARPKPRRIDRETRSFTVVQDRLGTLNFLNLEPSKV